MVLNFSKYGLLFLAVIGIEPATSRWFHSGALFNKNALSTAPFVFAG